MGVAGCVADFGGGGEGAEGWVEDDLLDDFGGCGCGAGRGEAGEVCAGDLEAVEEEAGAAWIELVAGDAAEDLADGALDGGTIFDEGEVEAAAAGAALDGVRDRATGGVVVIAEIFAAEAGAAAAVSVGEDVAALEAFWCVLHVCVLSPPG